MKSVAKTAMATPPTGVFLDLQLISLRESSTNPRKHFDAAGMKELVGSVRQKGVLVPLLVRPLNGKASGTKTHEIVAGARRFRAACEAKLPSVPVRVVELSDEETLEVQVIENLQREDVHPLDEALGYKKLLEMGGRDVKAIADKVGKSESYVYQRIKLADLIPAGQKAFWEEKITRSHAVMLARLQPADQELGLKECVVPRWRGDMISSRELADWIDREIHLDLAKAPWKKDDATLLPEAGSCVACPKRTGNAPALFPDIKKGDTCTDPACFARKGAALIQLRRNDAPDMPLVSTAYGRSGNEEKALKKTYPEIVWRESYTAAGSKKCPSLTDALVVHGEGAGTKIKICQAKRCKVHSSQSSSRHQAPRPSNAVQEREAKERAKERLVEATRSAVLLELSTKKLAIGVAELRAIGQELYFGGDGDCPGVPTTEPKWDRLAAPELTRMIVLLLASAGSTRYAQPILKACFVGLVKTNKINPAKIQQAAKAAVQEPSPKRGVCRICGCTHNTPCEGGCAWTDKTQTLCSTPACVKAAGKAKKGSYRA